MREIEHALLAGSVDIAIHSYKDLPTQSPEELTIGAVPKRLDPADMLVMTRESYVVSAATGSAEALPIANGARVGTASARRQAWIRHLRPDIGVVPIRGNVPTRINRLRTDLDGVVLAAAGIQRLRRSPLDGVADPVTEEFAVHRLRPVDFVPAPAQGALAIQCRRADAEIRELLRSLDHADTRLAVAAERELLARVEGGCDLAFGAWCAADGFPGDHTGCAGSPDIGVRAASRPIGTAGASPEAGTAEASLRASRLVAWLERDSVLYKADSNATDSDALADIAWAELERQWTG